MYRKLCRREFELDTGVFPNPRKRRRRPIELRAARKGAREAIEEVKGFQWEGDFRAAALGVDVGLREEAGGGGR